MENRLDSSVVGQIGVIIIRYAAEWACLMRGPRWVRSRVRIIDLSAPHTNTGAAGDRAAAHAHTHTHRYNVVNSTDMASSYVTALYFTTSSLTSVGFGNVSGNNNRRTCGPLFDPRQHAPRRHELADTNTIMRRTHPHTLSSIATQPTRTQRKYSQL